MPDWQRHAHQNIAVGRTIIRLLERHLQQRWKAGECDPEELTCSGLAYLERFLREAELDDCFND